MSKVENDESAGKSEPSCPAGYSSQWRDDEIDLVDLWLAMWSYRKLFLLSAISAVVIGTLCFELFFNTGPTYSVRSVIEIESTINGGKLINRVQYSKLPRFSGLSEFEPVKSLVMGTTISSVKKGSGIVEIVSKTPACETDRLSRFHRQLVDEILMELNASGQSSISGFQESLFSARSRIVSLQGILIALASGSLDGADSRETSNRLNPEEIALRKSNVESEIEILTERMKYLEAELSKAGSHVLLEAGVSEKGIAKTRPYTFIFMASLFLALLFTMGVIFARKVKERVAAGG